MLLLHQGKGKNQLQFPSISSDEFCEVAFTYLLLKCKFGYKAARDIQISPAQYLIKG